MALSAAASATGFDRTANTFQLDLSERLGELIREDNNAFLSKTGVTGFEASQKTHYFDEDMLNPNTSAISGAHTDSATTINVSAGHGLRFKIGSIFRIDAQNNTEVFQVTAISTDALTVATRPYGGAAASLAGGETIMIIGHNKQEDWEPSKEDWTKERTSRSNFLSTIGYGITISRIRELVNNQPISSELAHQISYRLKEFERSLDSTIINSAKSSTEGSDTVYPSLEGLIVSVIAGGNTTTSAQDLSMSAINAACLQIWNDAGFLSGKSLFLLCAGKQKQKISAFNQAYRRTDFDAKVAGYVVDKIVSDLGFELEIIVDPHTPSDTVIIGDWERVKVGPLRGDAIKYEELSKTGRLYQGMVTGTYTMETWNRDAFAIIRNLN